MSAIDPSSLERSEKLAGTLYRAHQQKIARQTDHLFAWLLFAQWIFGILLAVWISPKTWTGSHSEIHPHVLLAVWLGGAIVGLPVALAYWRRGGIVTRHVIAIAQTLFSGLLIHLTGGRIETHFHVFGSLAFLAFYRDWRVLVTATIVVAGDHGVRGLVWPESVYGALDSGWLRAIEHSGWVLFEDVFLILACKRGQAEMWEMAKREAQLNAAYEDVERQVEDRTHELQQQTLRWMESEERMRLLVESTDVIVWEYQPETRRFTYVSPQAEKLGYPIDSWYDVDFWPTILHEDDREAAINYCLEETEKGRGHRFQYRIRDPKGKVIWIDDLVSLCHDAEGGVWLRGTMVDISERKALEEELVNKVRELNEARLASEQASRAKSEFLANMSHEIRTPMTSILGYTDLLFEDREMANAPERRVEALRTIQRNGAHLLGILNDILDLSKIESGKFAVEFIPCSPMALVEETMSLMGVRAGQGHRLPRGIRNPCPPDDPIRPHEASANSDQPDLQRDQVHQSRQRADFRADDPGPFAALGIRRCGHGHWNVQRAARAALSAVLPSRFLHRPAVWRHGVGIDHLPPHGGNAGRRCADRRKHSGQRNTVPF